MDNITFCIRLLLLYLRLYTGTIFRVALLYLTAYCTHAHTCTHKNILLMYAICTMYILYIPILYCVCPIIVLLLLLFVIMIIIIVFMVPRALYNIIYIDCIVASASETAIIVLRVAIVRDGCYKQIYLNETDVDIGILIIL